MISPDGTYAPGRALANRGAGRFGRDHRHVVRSSTSSPRRSSSRPTCRSSPACGSSSAARTCRTRRRTRRARSRSAGPSAVSGLPVRAAHRRATARSPRPRRRQRSTSCCCRSAAARRRPHPTAPRRVKIGAGKVRYDQAEPASRHRLVHRRRDAGRRVRRRYSSAHRVREQSRFGDLVTGYPWHPLRTEVVVPTAVQDSRSPTTDPRGAPSPRSAAFALPCES